MGRLEEKVAIITGGGGGLGRSTALKFAAEGARVVVCGRSAGPLQETVGLIESAGGIATFVQGDVAVTEDVDAIVRGTVDAFGRVDCLVNNAALLMSSREAGAGTMGTTLEIQDDDWDQVMNVNLKGVFLMCRRVLPLMKEQGGGAILNVASTAAVQGYPNSHHYSATKGGLTAFTKSMAVTYGAAGVRVNALITGGFESPGVAGLMSLFAPLMADPQTRYLWCPLGRLATSEEIAPVIAFVCSDEASYIHGADIPVDGGQSINAVPNFGPRPVGSPLVAEDLLRAATAETGLEDYGDRGFVEGLTVFADALRTEAGLNQIGHMMQSGDMVRMLINRLRFQRDVTNHPEIRDEQIVAPIVIAGLPRTGTSKLQRMLSADPGVQRLDVWRLLNPAPFPGEEDGDTTGRLMFAQVVEKTIAQMFPDFMARHPTEAAEPDEELLLMELSLESVVSTLRNRVPSFGAFVEERGPRASYEYMKLMLQYLQWQDGGGRGRPWIMKSPVHLGNLALLFELFPDATVVHCHRDPQVVMPSFASLTEAGRRMGSDDVDLHELGAEVLDMWAGAMDRNLRDRATLGEDRILDVQYDRIRDDAAGVIADIYARAGHELTDEAIARMQAYEARRPAGHFGSHEYLGDRYGYTPELIADRFATYYQRLGDQS